MIVEVKKINKQCVGKFFGKKANIVLLCELLEELLIYKVNSRKAVEIFVNGEKMRRRLQMKNKVESQNR